uniref:Uncharacterized protein n=2 Tax=unclassified Caudoviricetes TaxID=2788787 RepID=A0A8S5QK61_9CAUD|nr:MAG TPA: hypothetical protein [Siphoviridae sp. ctVii20]DAE19386.1 MAG TPA: hypothetical protein [Siphoviridae sp. ctezl47]
MCYTDNVSSWGKPQGLLSWKAKRVKSRTNFADYCVMIVL